ncbi:MAG: bacterioferritin-associated ferredoxin [Burkholderiales bacterium]|jgi:bacterioferritin-associated ferredoxin|nr:bacterioferritin-associated ferredoxin [Burkholderiales bacterium]
MYVCMCHGITDRQIREAVSEGVGSMRELRAELGVASSCGCCAEYAKQLLDETLTGSQVPQLTAA